MEWPALLEEGSSDEKTQLQACELVSCSTMSSIVLAGGERLQIRGAGVKVQVQGLSWRANGDCFEVLGIKLLWIRSNSARRDGGSGSNMVRHGLAELSVRLGHLGRSRHFEARSVHDLVNGEATLDGAGRGQAQKGRRRGKLYN